MMEIFADPITVNCRKVLAGLKLMDVAYTLNKVDYFQGAQKGDEYAQINPNLALPAMRDGDFVLWESNAILQYAAERDGKLDYYPADLKIRADLHRWLGWECGSWFPSCYIYLVENAVKPLMEAEPDPAVLEAESERFHRLAGILDNRLADSQWLCGTSGPTIADIVVAAPMHLYDEAKLPLDQHRHVMRWMKENVEALPCWQQTRIGPGFVVLD